ncbi:hypothetical protein SUDANB148_05668 [Streptomyces sp. SudanB148_2056]
MLQALSYSVARIGSGALGSHWVRWVTAPSLRVETWLPLASWS